jgi:hypothetical protein
MLHHLEGWNGEPPMKPEETRAIKVMWRENLDKRKWHLMYRVSRLSCGWFGTSQLILAIDV